MNIEQMDMEQVETRLNELKDLLHTDGADLEAIEAEVRSLKEHKASLKAEVQRQKDAVAEVLRTATKVQTFEREETKKHMEIRELKNTPEYIDAFAEYIKGNDKAIRSLLTENGGGTVAVPDFVHDEIITSWDNSQILSRIRKTYITGDFKVNYEQSATGAAVHNEGEDAPAEEALVLGTVEFTNKYFKKWIRVSDSVLALRGRAFLDYLYDEFGHQIALALEEAVIAAIVGSNLKATARYTNPSQAVLLGLAKLSDEARDPVAIMNKQTYANIKGIRTTTGAKLEDPFEGLEVLFNSKVAAGTILVGDLQSVIGNFPEGTEIKYVFDEYTYAEEDLVKIVGKIMASIHLVRPNGFAVVTEDGGEG